MNSVALMILLLRESLPLDEAVFADTGGEVPETYEYLEVAREYLAVRNVPLTVVAKNGDSLYERRGDGGCSLRRSGAGRPGTSRSRRFIVTIEPWAAISTSTSRSPGMR